jgi:short-subunit dehydrogenase
MEIDQRRIVVTGASSGIGRELLFRLGQRPAQIVAAGRNQASLQAAIADIPARRAEVFPFLGDLSRAEEMMALFDQAEKDMGGVDLFIANAGVGYYESLLPPNWEQVEQVFRLNVISTIFALQKLKAMNVGRDFKLVCVASAMAYWALPGYAVYAATKAALERFAEGARFELKRPQQLMMVYPIATRTSFFERAGAGEQLPLFSQSAGYVAEAILRGIRSDGRDVYPSRLFAIALWFDRRLPVLRRMYQMMELRRFEKWRRKL